MKILLINPPPHIPGENSRFLEKSPMQTYTMPLGLGYIASALENAGNSVRLVDAYVKRLPHSDIEEIIRDFEPDVIGITCLSDQRASWYKLVELIRSIDTRIKIVLGGAHPSLMPEQVLKRCLPDAIVIGEGDETIIDLLSAWEGGGHLSDVKGIAYMMDGEPVVTAPRERIQDIDRLRSPAFHLVDIDDYKGWDFMELLSRLLGRERPPKYASISTSRGCVGDCGYCSAPLIWKRRWTQKGPISVVDEMEMLQRQYGIEFIIMNDDIFSVNQERIIAICDEIERRGLNILWGFETAVNFVSTELLRRAKNAGCCCILYGVESGSGSVLASISKRIREEDVVSAFRMTKDAGILSGAFLMVGNPSETEKSINDTIRLLRRIDPAIILPQIAMITPCTKTYRIAKEKGFIGDSYWLTDLPFPYYTCEQNLKTLLRWHRKIFYYKKTNIGIFLRTLRDYIEFHIGIRISKTGLSKTEIPRDQFIPLE